MAGNEFKPRKYVDHEIVDADGLKMGDIRVKPSGILWSPRGRHAWFRINLEQFAQFMESKGKKQKK
jgi:hypothetical protein